MALIRIILDKPGTGMVICQDLIKNFLRDTKVGLKIYFWGWKSYAVDNLVYYPKSYPKGSKIFYLDRMLQVIKDRYHFTGKALHDRFKAQYFALGSLYHKGRFITRGKRGEQMAE